MASNVLVVVVFVDVCGMSREGSVPHYSATTRVTRRECGQLMCRYCRQVAFWLWAININLTRCHRVRLRRLHRHRRSRHRYCWRWRRLLTSCQPVNSYHLATCGSSAPCIGYGYGIRCTWAVADPPGPARHYFADLWLVTTSRELNDFAKRFYNCFSFLHSPRFSFLWHCQIIWAQRSCRSSTAN